MGNPHIGFVKTKKARHKFGSSRRNPEKPFSQLRYSHPRSMGEVNPQSALIGVSTPLWINVFKSSPSCNWFERAHSAPDYSLTKLTFHLFGSDPGDPDDIYF